MLRKNVCEIMLDTTGDGLHKRGYRRNAMEAPIRETLAATIADLGRVRRDSLVEDPFCGSGTLLIEAAQKAMNIAPGLKRRFAAERYSFVPAPSGPSSARRLWPTPSWTWALRPLATTSTPPPWRWPTPTPSWPVWKSAATSRWPMWPTFAARARGHRPDQPPVRRAHEHHRGCRQAGPHAGPQMEAHPCAGVYAITADMEFETPLRQAGQQAPQDVQRHDPLPAVYVLQRPQV